MFTLLTGSGRCRVQPSSCGRSPGLVDDLRAGTIDSLVLQDPFQIDYRGLRMLIDFRAGKNPPRVLACRPHYLHRRI
jgi:hypothetical protein